jgi:hypothetical protein
MRALTRKKVHLGVWRLSRYVPSPEFPRGLAFTVADFYTLHYLTDESLSAIS